MTYVPTKNVLTSLLKDAASLDGQYYHDTQLETRFADLVPGVVSLTYYGKYTTLRNISLIHDVSSVP